MATAQKPATVKFLEVKARSNEQALVFTFGNGTKMTFDTRRASEAMREQAMMHGFNQKLRDTTAEFSKAKDYAGAIEAVTKVWESILAGSWNRTGGGTAGALMEDLAHALAEIRGVDFAKAMAAVEKATPEQRAGWAKNAKVAAKIADRRAARLAAAAQTASDDDLQGIDFGEEGESAAGE